MKSTLEISGIKCDSCDYKDANVCMEDYDKWLNRPCPVCGNNLLTEPDYELVQQLTLFVETQNRNMPANNTNEPMLTATLEMNGSGSIEIENLKLKE